MNVVVLQGVLSSAPVSRQLASGSVAVSLELSTPADGPGHGVASVPVAWFDPPVDVAWEAGTELVVLGTVRRRFFRTGGLTQSRTEVVAEQVAPAGRRRSVDKVLRAAGLKLGGDGAVAVRST